MLYLSGPIYHENPEIVKYRLQVMSHIGYILMRYNIPVFSPHAHNIGIKQFGEVNNRELWLHLDKKILMVCSCMIVVTIRGWEESKGVQEEIEFANEYDIPVVMISPDNLKEWIESEQAQPFVLPLESTGA